MYPHVQPIFGPNITIGIIMSNLGRQFLAHAPNYMHQTVQLMVSLCGFLSIMISACNSRMGRMLCINTHFITMDPLCNNAV